MKTSASPGPEATFRCNRFSVTRIVLGFTAATLSALAAADEFPTFKAHTIDAEIGKVCYAVTMADVNNDGQPDIVAVSENRVLWYENPSWTAHVMIHDQTPPDNVCIAPHDIDGDGKIDFAIGAGWTKSGTLHWIRRGASLSEPWHVYSIGTELSLHRARWADVLGTGRPQLVISPLNKSVGNGVRLTAFEIPPDPVTERWPTSVLNEELNRMHNHWHADMDENGSVDTITASEEGVTLVQRGSDGWNATRLATGADGTLPAQQGAGEVRIGRLKNGLRYIVTVEPMHGHSVAVYTQNSDNKKSWNRHVIDSGFQRGHGLWTSDLDGDGSEEIVFGHSDTPKTFGVIVYQCTDQVAVDWKKHVVDEGGMATEDLMVADFTGDGRPDIVAGGRATHNLKLYVNQKP